MYEVSANHFCKEYTNKLFIQRYAGSAAATALVNKFFYSLFHILMLLLLLFFSFNSII